MTAKIILAAVLLAASVGWASTSLAEGAFAVGMPEGNPSKGFRWSAQVNKPDMAAATSAAMTDCRASRNPKVGAACLLIASFADQCVAIAVSGDPDPAPVSAAGWAVASSSDAAIDRAIALCELVRKGRGQKCVLDGGRDNALLCDGKAK
jgi:hypothetical protein